MEVDKNIMIPQDLVGTGRGRFLILPACAYCVFFSWILVGCRGGAFVETHDVFGEDACAFGLHFFPRFASQTASKRVNRISRVACDLSWGGRQWLLALLPQGRWEEAHSFFGQAPSGSLVGSN